MPVSVIRNGCLARFVTPAAGWFNLFVVPPNETVLLKSVLLQHTAPGADTVRVYVSSSSGAQSNVLISVEMTGDASHEWNGWIGLNHGDQLVLNDNAGGVHAWASGAALPGLLETLPSAAAKPLAP